LNDFTHCRGLQLRWPKSATKPAIEIKLAATISAKKAWSEGKKNAKNAHQDGQAQHNEPRILGGLSLFVLPLHKTPRRQNEEKERFDYLFSSAFLLFEASLSK